MNFFRNFFNGKRNTENSNIKTPKFIGSEDDFTKFIGPYSRNLVQRITKKYKNTKGRCEHCDIENVQLDAAHIRGKERKEIIKSIIKFNTNGSFEVNLNEFEQEFIKEHDPIENVIKILCQDCHNKYDSPNTKIVNKPISVEEILTPNKTKEVIMKDKSSIITKDSAIKIINEKLTLTLNSNKTNWSNINANGVWSIEPNLQRQNHDLYLILNNNRTKKMHVFKIPEKHEVYKKLYIRNDKSVFRLLFNIDDNVFVETLKGINFKDYYVDTINYS
jgi:hypothetical protein